MKITKEQAPFFIALALGVVALLFYIFTGRGSYDTSVRELTKQPSIENIDASDTQNIKITCKSGENYEITFKEGQQNYQDLIFNACGPEGTQEAI
ncbi:hypothetical protein IT413_02530 [Candidatus Peregrinibacteria bacterium]|nr:hypothetical protein [Candidatus Peregrinibacteria bacterium]